MNDTELSKQLKRIENKQKYIIDLLTQVLSPPPDIEVKRMIEQCDGDVEEAMGRISKLNKVKYG